MSDARPTLRDRRRPPFEHGADPLNVVDLFAGCGGLTLGIAQAARASGRALDVRLAVDFEEMATAVYAANFPRARVETKPVEAFFDGALGDPLSLVEHRTRAAVGETDVLIGGPPCQGHSNLNNRTRRVDAKNGLYLRMARATEVLHPKFVLIENVPSVVRDRHDGENVVDRADQHLRTLGYQTTQSIVSLARLGVAQTRRRHLLIATEADGPDPQLLVADAIRDHIDRDLRWAIGDLVDAPEVDLLDRRPRPTATNLARMQFLLERDLYDLPNDQRPECHRGDHTYRSMYGRLRWDRPAQTITSGYGSIGQGRYMHPEQPRALTAHEAARIQGFPDYFSFSACPTRSALATMIGNAVPPQLGRTFTGSYLERAATMEAQAPAPAQQTA